MLASGVDAFRSKTFGSHPFVGEHADATVINHGDRTTHLADSVSVTSDKYAAIKTKSNFRSHRSAETRLYEKIFGESEESLNQ